MENLLCLEYVYLRGPICLRLPSSPQSHSIFLHQQQILANPELVGWSGKRIIMAGDSAGGNLAAALTIRASHLALPKLLMLSRCPSDQLALSLLRFCSLSLFLIMIDAN